mmetsp:Transcript_29114/g.73168  ORF Transcript_29114/g.73168 Transcript_29114/m.73168 type:complete len:248 (-) Transcript_29114:232-975(-)
MYLELRNALEQHHKRQLEPHERHHVLLEQNQLPGNPLRIHEALIRDLPLALKPMQRGQMRQLHQRHINQPLPAVTDPPTSRRGAARAARPPRGLPRGGHIDASRRRELCARRGPRPRGGVRPPAALAAGLTACVGGGSRGEGGGEVCGVEVGVGGAEVEEEVEARGCGDHAVEGDVCAEGELAGGDVVVALGFDGEECFELGGDLDVLGAAGAVDAAPDAVEVELGEACFDGGGGVAGARGGGEVLR